MNGWGDGRFDVEAQLGDERLRNFNLGTLLCFSAPLGDWFTKPIFLTSVTTGAASDFVWLLPETRVDCADPLSEAMNVYDSSELQPTAVVVQENGVASSYSETNGSS